MNMNDGSSEPNKFKGRRPLPSGWAETQLADVCAVNPRTFTTPIDDECPVSFVPMAAVEAGTGLIDASQVRKYGEVRKGYTRFSEGDVLFAKITPCMENGKVAIAKILTNGSGCGSTEFHVVRAMGGLSNKYLAHFLIREEFRKEAQRHMAGTAGQLRVPPSFLSDAPFPLPPLPEQRRIVAEIEKQFTRLDASVAALRRTQANLKRYRASSLRAACSGALVPTEAEIARAEGREYEPAGVLLERILAERRARWEAQEKRRGRYREPAAPDTSDLPPLPEGWAWATVGQIGDLKGGVTKGQRQKEGHIYREVPYLRVANVQRGYLDLATVKTISVPETTIEQLKLVEGDVLFNEGGDRDKLGRGWIWNGEITECIHQNHVFRARMLTGDTLPEFISWWGNSFGKEYFERTGKQTTNLASINLSVLTAFPVPLPPLAEQQRIVAEVERRLSVIQQAEAAVEASLQRAERLRQSILKRAFSGELVPQDPDDEPASALLERIRAQRDAEQTAASASKKRPARRRSRQKQDSRD